MTILLWALLTLVAIVLVAEYCARFWLRFIARTYPWRPFTHFAITPDRRILPQLSAATTFKANSLGLRGREAPAKDHVLRIVTCGGSAVECFSLDDSEAWPALVEAHLSVPEVKSQLRVDDVHVLNCAKSGFTNEALGYLLPRILDRLGPIDILTITTGTSAVNAWTKAGTPPFAQAPGHAWEDIHWHGEATWGFAPRTCALAEVARRLTHLWAHPVTVLNNTGGSLAAARKARQTASEVRDTTSDPQAWISDYESSLTALVLTASRYARCVVLLRQSWFNSPHPSEHELVNFWHGFVGDAPAGERKVFYSYNAFSRLMAETDAANIRVAQRLGIETISLGDAVEPTLENYYDQIHYAPAGARRVAAFVARELRRIVLQSRGRLAADAQSGHRPAA